MQPVDAFLEEGVAAGHRLVVTPVVGALESVCDGGEVREHHLADVPFAGVATIVVTDWGALKKVRWLLRSSNIGHRVVLVDSGSPADVSPNAPPSSPQTGVRANVLPTML